MREDKSNIHRDIILHSSPLRQVNEEDEQQQRRVSQEEEESLALARSLMAEEAVASYAAHLDYLRDNQDQFSEEDLAALQAAMGEDDDEYEDNGSDDEENAGHDMSYETMLQLGERLGDVKSERWAQVARAKIDALPVVEFDPNKVNRMNSTNDCDVKCLICQEDYRTGEMLRQLPQCGHRFHIGCIDKWLLSKDFCPYCRTELEYKENETNNIKSA